MESIPELKYNSALKEEKFNDFYDDFFQRKILVYLKNVKRNHYTCASNCITEDNIIEECLDKCQENHTKFFKHIELLLQAKLSSFHSCIEKCSRAKDSVYCADECTNHTIHLLNQIDPAREFSKFLNKDH